MLKLFFFIFLTGLCCCIVFADTVYAADREKRSDGAEKIAITSLVGSYQNPAWSPDSGKFVFTNWRKSYNSGDAYLYIIDLSDDSKTLLLDGYNVNMPGGGSIWNENTGKIVFASERNDQTENAWQVKSDGTELEMITGESGYMAWEPGFSKNGDWVVYERVSVSGKPDTDPHSIYKSEIGTPTNRVALTNITDDKDCRQPAWSPAGNLICYQKRNDKNSPFLIFVCDAADGGNKRQLLDTSEEATDCSFSPDGKWIVFSSEYASTFANIFICPTAGELHKPADWIRVTNDSGYDGAPGWSPDGTKILFEHTDGDPDSSSGSTIWMIDVPGYTLTYLTDSNGTISGSTPQVVAANGDGTPVTPVPNPGDHFTVWSDASISNPRTDTNVTADITVTANFAINPSYTLTVISGSGGGTVVEGQSAAITADPPATGFHFVTWTTSDGGIFNNAKSSDTSYTMPGNNATVTATFSDKYTLTYTAGSNGSITGTTPQQVKEGLDGAPVTAVPDIGFHFIDWSDGVTTAARTETNVIADITVTANFAENKLSLIIDSSSIVENGGTSTATVSRNTETTGELIVSLSSNDTSEATVPASVTIPSGSPSAVFTITAVKDDLVDGTKIVVISATAALHTGASGTISVIDGKEVAFGLLFTIKASEIKNPSGGTLTEFVNRPKVYAAFTDPVKGKERKTQIKVLTDVPAVDGSQVTEVNCEWKRNVRLYDKRALRAANKEGIYTSYWLRNNPLSNLLCSLNVRTYLPDWTRVDDDIDKKLLLTPPEITDVETLNGVALGSDSVQPENVIVLKGKYFGYKPPKVWMEYLNSKNKVKKQRLKVEKIFEYKDARGNEEKSCMDVVTGESKIRIQMPKKWWRDWTAGSYSLVIDNKVGLASTLISTAE